RPPQIIRHISEKDGCGFSVDSVYRPGLLRRDPSFGHLSPRPLDKFFVHLRQRSLAGSCPAASSCIANVSRIVKDFPLPCFVPPGLGIASYPFKPAYWKGPATGKMEE